MRDMLLFQWSYHLSVSLFIINKIISAKSFSSLRAKIATLFTNFFMPVLYFVAPCAHFLQLIVSHDKYDK